MQARRSPLLLVLVAAAVVLALSHGDEIRARAELALERGMPRREAALARGFVLGEEEGIDAETKEDFRRSGLAHLLAVSGQNVALLALLAMPVLAALGMPLRSRLLWILGLIAVYVPLAGAGPSIQRAGIMGALGVLATLAGRPTWRFYALVVAAAVLLVLDPDVAADVGWQLSFAAVLGILLLATPLRAAIGARLGSRGWRRPIAEGAAVTIAATLATAPLLAFHFEALSTTTLLANLLALPAVAPAMWLGMLVAAAGQVPGFPLEALSAVNALLLAYIAQVAAWCGGPSWAYVNLRLGIGGLLAAYAAIAAATLFALRRGARLLVPVLSLGLVVPALAVAWTASGSGTAAPPIQGLRVSVLDVGQGDAVLLQPGHAPALLVDGGPPGDGLAAELRATGVDRLGAAVVTHDQSDHVGGIRELLGAMPIGSVLHGVLRRSTLVAAHAAGARTRRLARGSEVCSGALCLEVLWPPAELLAGPRAGEDPNRLALVMLARWQGFSMLLAADAEAETTPLDPGPVDVLKVAHHGSDDAGLDDLLDRARPHLAVISVGDDNPFGHPTAATLAMLAAHRIRTLRTDADGTVVLDVGRDSIRVSTD